MAAQIQLRRGTAADLYAVNPVLARGEPVLEIDTNKVKYGDGTTAWRDLPYAVAEFELEVVDGGALTPVRPGPTEDFSPPNLSGLALWLDAADDDFISLVGGKVAQWDDKSINKRSFFQSRAANRPGYSNTINDLSVVTFDGANDGMLASFELQPVFTLFVVFNPRGSSNAGRVFTALNAAEDTSPTGFIPCVVNGDDVSARVGSDYRGAQSAVTFAPALYSVAVTANDFTTTLNGFTPSTDVHAIAGNFTNFAIGASRANFAGAFNGDIAEVVIYNRVLSEAEYEQVSEYLLGKWGIIAVSHPLLSGMTAFWPMNEDNGNRLDISGNNKTLAVAGNVTSSAGVVGKAAQLSGGSNYLQNTTLSLNPTAFTVSFWFKSANITGEPAVRQVIQNWNDNATTGQFVIGWGDEGDTAGALWAYVRTTTATPRVAYTALAAGTWSHIVLTFDAATNALKLYADGVLVDSAQTTGNLVTTTNPFQVGVGESGGALQTVPCAVDSVGVWNRALPISEIEMLYNAGFGKEDFEYDLYGDNVELLLHMNKLAVSGSAAGGDPDFNNVSLLMHFDADFNDSSTNNLQGTSQSNAAISTAQSVFGGASLYIPNTGGWVYVPYNQNFDFGTGDFTVEMWLRPESTSAAVVVGGTVCNSWAVYRENGHIMLNILCSPSTISSQATLPINEWTHVAFCRSAGTLRLFLNGVEDASVSDATDLSLLGNQLRVGLETQYGTCDGYIEDLRITKGIARYTANFTPPTAPFPDQAGGGSSPLADGLVAFYKFDDLNDSSGNNHTLTNNSGVTFTPGKLGNAATFNGGQSMIAMPGTAVPTTAFSGAAWVYLNASNWQGNWIFSSVTGNNWGGGGIDLLLEPDRRVTVGAFYGSGMAINGDPVANSFGFSGQTPIPYSGWHHIAGTFDSTTGIARVYVDGVLDAETTWTNLPPGPFGGDQTSNLSLGSNSDSTWGHWNGQIDAVGLWNRELSAEEVALLYNAGAGTEDVAGAPPAPITYFYDNSKNHYTVTANGGAQIVTNVKKYGNASGKFTADGDHLELPSSAGDLGGGDFTVEFWCNPSAFSDYTTIAGNFLNSGAADWQIVCNGSAGQLSWYTQGFAAFSGSITTNAWSHVAFVRSAGVLSLYINGVLAGSAPHTNNYTTPANALWIGHTPENLSGRNFAGHLDDFRITKGVARYNANFTPPAKELPDPVIVPANNNTDPYAEDVVLLLHFDGAGGSTNFVDNSYVGHEVTASGGAVISTTQSKWGGASGYFNGSDSVIKLPYGSWVKVDTGDFTIEAWIYPTATGYQQIFGRHKYGFTSMYVLLLNENNELTLYENVTNGSAGMFNTAGISVPTNQWSHVAVTRQNGLLRLFVNGVAGTSYTVAGSLDNELGFTDEPISIGGPENAGGWMFNGYIDDLRVTKGVARYTGPFTPPTAAFLNPFVPGVEPALLMHFDGTSFVDSSPNALTITATNNPELSSTQSKFGGKSVYFSGPNSRAKLEIAESPAIQLGSADFTIEFWLYLMAQDAGGGTHLVGRHVSNFGANWLIAVQNSTGKLYWEPGSAGSSAFSNSQIPTNTWTHLAVTRSGGTCYIFIDGVLEGTGPISGSLDSSIVAPLTIGTDQTNTNSMTGYIDELRIVKGQALYTSTFTPPTEPFGAGFTPAAISGLDLWLDAKDSQFVTYNNDVLTWSDKSAGANDASNVDYSPRPTIVEASTPTGTDAVRFSGDPNTLEVQNIFNFKNSTGFVVLGQPGSTGDLTSSRSERILSFASAFGQDWNTADGMVLGLDVNAGNTGNNYINLTSQHPTLVTTSSLTLPLEWSVASYTIDNDAYVTLGLNGASYGSQFQSSTEATYGGNLYIGSNITADPDSSLRADIAAVLHYDHKLGAGALAAVEKYLTNKFLAAAAPTSSEVLLAHFDSVIADDSAYERTLTAYNGAALSSTESKFGNSSVYFDGVDDYIEVSDPSAFNFGAEDFTVEGWFYTPNSNAVNSVFSQRRGDIEQELSYDLLVLQGSTYMVLSTNGTSWAVQGGGSVPVPNDQWVHLAYVRSGTNFYAFVNGELSQTLSLTGALFPSAAPFRLGGNTFTGQFAVGYLDEVRVTKGHAVYTANFTPPTVPFNATQLILHLDSNLNDSGDNNFTVTALGDAALDSNQSKFGGFSLYLTNSSDALLVSDDGAFSFGDDDFTVEAWVYLTDTSIVTIFGKRNWSSEAQLEMQLHVYQGSTFIVLSQNGTSWSFANGGEQSVPTNEWVHLAYVRQGTSVRAYINGVLSQDDFFDGTVFAGSGEVRLAKDSTNHWVDEIRIIKGYAAYTSNFTPPSAPFNS